jgi:hypothetical protein
LFLSIFFSIGCENDMEYRGNDVKLKEVKNEQNEVTAYYTYNEKGWLKSMWAIPYEAFTKEKMEFTYEYDSKDRLSRVRGFVPGNPIMSSMMAFEHQVVSEYEYDLPDEAWSVTTENIFGIEPQYEGWIFKAVYKKINENVIECTRIDKDQVLQGYRSLFFFSEEGNLIEMQEWNIDQNGKDFLFAKSLLEYDEGYNPFYNPFVLEDRSKNNLVKKNVIVYDLDNHSEVAYTYSYQFGYVYNRKNYPVSRTTLLPNTNRKVEYFEYY